MEVSLYQAAAAMSATARWQDLIAENLSAASVPGSRKQEVTFSDVAAGLNSSGSMGHSVPTANVVTNFEPGELRSTGNPLDFALEGNGFFTIQMPNGQKAYTRDGEFLLNSRKELVTKDGSAVQGQGGSLRFNPNNAGAITVSASGDVSQGDQRIGKLAVVEFKDMSKLTMHGTGIFTADDPANKPLPSTTQIRQGFIESANTSPTTEMASMITAMRTFEANQKVLQMQSDRMSRAITDLGGTTSS